MSNQPELFPVETITVYSPRLKWMRDHRLVTEKLADTPGTESPETGDEIPCWVCRRRLPSGAHYRPRDIGGGDTEELACIDWAKNAGVKPWNQNPF